MFFTGYTIYERGYEKHTLKKRQTKYSVQIHNCDIYRYCSVHWFFFDKIHNLRVCLVYIVNI